MESKEKNKLIIKNTLLLYLRMLFLMCISLYTSRIVLNALGIEDYGIYNVVGGVIAMISFINGSLSGASSRFITFTLGEGNKEKLKKTFSTILFIHIAIAILIVLLGESIGLWFVYNILVIPVERIDAAIWAYHFSVLNMAISIISVPYNALIIAHEKMSAFAYISIIEGLLKLSVVFIIIYVNFDRLILYSFLILCIQILIRFIYNKYCVIFFPESKVRPKYNKRTAKQIVSYAMWTMNGCLAVIGYTQGLNLLLNIFFGPIVNAARGIAVQVQSAISSFVSNFQTAVRPQIIKSYAIGDIQHMHQLVIYSSKFGYYLLLIISFPFLIFTEQILTLWLGIIPDHTITFVKIMILTALLEPLKQGVLVSIHATGDLKKFQIWEGCTLLTVVPICYLMLKLFNISPEFVLVIYLIIEFITQGIRVYIVLPKINMKFRTYLFQIIFPIIIPSIVTIAPVFLLNFSNNYTLIDLISYVCTSFLYSITCILLTGTNTKEKKFLYSQIKTKIKHIK